MTDKKIEQVARLLYEKHWSGSLSVWTFEKAERYLKDTERETFIQEAKQIAALYSQEPGMVKLDKDQTPTFARVDIKGKPEVGRFYDGYLAGQKDMYKANFKRIER
jgi:hypothetical protein